MCRRIVTVAKIGIALAAIALQTGAGAAPQSATLSTATAVVKVVDGNGKPVAGASVGALYPSGRDTRPSAVTDAGGLASLVIPNVGTEDEALCSVLADGYAVGSVIAHEGRIETVTLVPPVSETGTVIDPAGKPVTGAKVRLSDIRSGPNMFLYFNGPTLVPLFSAVTDSSGRYTIHDLPAGYAVDVVLDDDRFALAIANGTTPGEADPLVAEPASSITGKVTCPDGTPAAHVQVFARSTSGSNGFAFASTDTDGSYTLKKLAGATYTIQARYPMAAQLPGAPPPKWAPGSVAGVTVKSGASAAAPDIAMTRASLLTVTVIDKSDGKPISNSTVNAITPGPQPFDQVAVTGIDGTCQFRLAQGTYQVIGYGRGDYVSQAAPRTVTIGDSDSSVSFALVRGAGVQGKLVDETGKPVSGLAIWISRSDASQDTGPQEFQSDQSGAFDAHGLAPGTYTLVASDPWRIVSPKTVALAVGRDANLTIVLSRMNTTSLTGRIVDEEGSPIAGASIQCNIQYEIGHGGQSSRQVQARSDSAGRFVIDGFTTNDTYVGLSVSKPGYTLVSGGDVTGTKGSYSVVTPVMAALDGAVSGVVRKSDGAPAPGAWVIADRFGSAFPVRADGNGRFKIGGLISGPIDLIAAQGNEVGRATARASASPAVCRIDLDDAGSPPPAGDLHEALKMLLTECRISSGSPSPESKADCIASLGLYDPDFALSTMSLYGAPDSFALAQIIENRLVVDPIGGAQWAVAHAGLIGDPSWRQRCLLDAGIAAAPYNRVLAGTLYDMATRPDAAAHANMGYNTAQLRCTLAAALGRPEADALVRQCLTDANKKDVAKPSPNFSYVAWFLSILARGDVQQAVKLADDLGDKVQAEARQHILANSGYGGPLAVQTAFHLITPDPSAWWSDDDTMGAEAQSLVILGRQDPAELAAVAQDYAGSSPGALALLDEADATPMPQAADLYRKAFAATQDYATQECSPAMVAGRAWLRDKALFADLFAQARALVGHMYATGMVPPNATDFAFYYARVDPAMARLMIEHQFGEDNSAKDNSFYVEADALAMAAIDPRRAAAMAFAVSDEHLRERAFEEIANYLMAPEPMRDAIDFSDWSMGMLLTPSVLPPAN